MEILKTRQTIIFSVTETIKEEDLARLSLQKIGVYIEVDHGQKRNVVAASENEERRVREKCSKCRRKRQGFGKKGDVLRRINLYGWRIMKNFKENGL